MDATSAVILLTALISSAVAAFLLARCILLCAPSGGPTVWFEQAHCAIDKRAKKAAESMLPKLIAIPFVGETLRKRRSQKRSQEIRKEMPRALRLLCISLESGGSISNAIEYAASNCSGALSEELKRAVWDLEAGLSFDEAMEQLRTRTDGSEFAYLAVAMEIQHTCGGQLSDVLQSVTTMMQQEAELEDLLVTKTSQGQLSTKVLMAMPVVLLGVLTVFSPGYLSGFFTSAAGVVIFIAALLMEAMGILLVRRCLAVDLSVTGQEAS